MSVESKMSLKAKIGCAAFFSIMGIVSIIGERMCPGESVSLWLAPLQLLCGVAFTGVLIVAFAVFDSDLRSSAIAAKGGWVLDLFFVCVCVAVYIGVNLGVWFLHWVYPNVGDRTHYYLMVSLMAAVLVVLAMLSNYTAKNDTAKPLKRAAVTGKPMS